ncbi:hypothetical protein HYH03_006951 [Edaphochlamys debaryana]|uniref:Uncharacterized protein n=1 Tax=Edaphochlamys debaryana TaxID=47281 RepID=A0A835YCJ6_9CHLO|nr:hypothetical protein HYH03_006951 [Edaphochlamys debaryana]|eukprot:KAG2495019.1 hypothetical protein HYH03_006951 [Edaphochlamys debaryana]
MPLARGQGGPAGAHAPAPPLGLVIPPQQPSTQQQQLQAIMGNISHLMESMRRQLDELSQRLSDVIQGMAAGLEQIQSQQATSAAALERMHRQLP